MPDGGSHDCVLSFGPGKDASWRRQDSIGKFNPTRGLFVPFFVSGFNFFLVVAYCQFASLFSALI